MPTWHGIRGVEMKFNPWKMGVEDSCFLGTNTIFREKMFNKMVV
jgi:hypothetical protein